MADKSTVCTICDERHIYRQSTDWCFECEQALCSECKEFHAISKSSRNHATIPITDYQTLASSISSVSNYCSDHEEKCRMFCQTHDKLLCVQCSQKHHECKDVIPLSNIIKNVKTSEAFRETEQCLIDIDENILNIYDKIKDKIIIFNEQKGMILSEIGQVRQKIIDHLDQIEADIRKEISDIEHKAITELETALTVLTKRKENNSTLKQQLENVRKHASDLQAFFALRHISSEITTTDTFLQSIIDGGHLDKIEFSVNEDLISIPDKIKTFGSICADKSPGELTIVKPKEKQAQLVGVHSASIQDIKLELIQQITPKISHTSGCDILPDGKLVFCDEQCLIVSDTNGKYLFTVSLEPWHVFDVTCISDKTVAVTTGLNVPYGINITDISSRKILKFIPKLSPCFGITSVNGSLVYLVGRNIEMMDADGKNTTTIVKILNKSYITSRSDALSCIASHNGKLYFTSQSTHTVTCCDMKGKTIWTFKDETFLREPSCISVDNDGHVYVVSNWLKSVVVLSADGQQSRQILYKKDKLNNPESLDPFFSKVGFVIPTAIFFDRTRKQLLVGYPDSCLLFRVSS